MGVPVLACFIEPTSVTEACISLRYSDDNGDALKASQASDVPRGQRSRPCFFASTVRDYLGNELALRCPNSLYEGLESIGRAERDHVPLQQRRPDVSRDLSANTKQVESLSKTFVDVALAV